MLSNSLYFATVLLAKFIPSDWSLVTRISSLKGQFIGSLVINLFRDSLISGFSTKQWSSSLSNLEYAITNSATTFSVTGISSINTCPKILKNYYKKNCLMALSLYGNNLMPGRSIIIFLLNDTLDKVNSFEKIYLGKDMKLRHFVTNEKNELYEDKQGNIYVSADLKGIYKISFSDFR